MSSNSQSDDTEIVLAPPSAWALIKILVFPAFEAGETYKEGRWYLKKGELTKFLEVLYENKSRIFFQYFCLTYRLKHLSFWIRQNLFTRHFTRKVRRHYELDPHLYSTFLDAEMVYTCAFFEGEEDSLASAQSRKLDTVISRMQLPDTEVNVLEIGCGWGSFARRIVSTHPYAHYTGLTIAKDQIDHAMILDRERLNHDQIDRVHYRLEDYLDHSPEDEPKYDGISVIGMMEHVGQGHHGVFLQKICSLLKLKRRAVIHTIICGKSGQPTNSWIDRYIFHGGYAPSIAEIATAVETCSCRIENVFVHDPTHYRLTIECWLSNFLSNWDKYKESNLKDWSESRTDELFRIWHFYLSAVRNMFVPDAMDHQVAHVVVIKA